MQIRVVSVEKVIDCHPALEDQMSLPLLYLETVGMKLVNDATTYIYDKINEE